MPLSSVLGAQSLVRPGVCTSTTRPASPFEGQTIYETDTDLVKSFDGTNWNTIGPTTVPTQKVLQVVQSVKTDTFSAAVGVGSTTAVTGFTASITPSATSSKVLVMVNAQLTHQNNAVIHGRLTRGGTAINGATGDAASTRQRVSGVTTGSNYANTTLSFNYLDSPSSTSSVTYGLIVSHSNTNGADGNTIYLNRSTNDTDNTSHYRSASFITLMEITA